LDEHDAQDVTYAMTRNCCDVLAVPGEDLKIVAYTAPAGTPPAEKLDFLRVIAINAHVTTDSLRPAESGSISVARS
jgi:hypothetical protein